MEQGSWKCQLPWCRGGTSECGLEGHRFKSHQSHNVGFFSLGQLLPTAGGAVGPVGKAWIAQLSFGRWAGARGSRAAGG